MANGFDTDYDFLNLPEAGSGVSGPIEAVARVCEKHNPNFDWNRFDMACRSCYHSAEAYNDR